jgi:hypothetical protein
VQRSDLFLQPEQQKEQQKQDETKVIARRNRQSKTGNAVSFPGESLEAQLPVNSDVASSGRVSAVDVVF